METKQRGIGFQPVRLEQKLEGIHEYLRTKFMESMKGWKPVLLRMVAR